MIPEERTAAVSRGLEEAFGVTEFEDIRIIKDLASSLVCRIVVRGSPFLLKISTRTNDPARHYGCMNAAAEAGLAPRVRYCNAQDRVSIEDFVEIQPFPITEAMVRVPSALRTLHAVAPFPVVPNHINTTCMFLINKGPALDAYFQRFRSAGILPRNETEQLFERHAELSAVYPHSDTEMVSSHNDLFRPDNMLFDGHRLWLVDWEAAFLNDRYADLAVVANLIVGDETQERAFLQEYFGSPATTYQLARLFLMRQLAHIFYGMAFLLIGSSGKPIDWTEAVPEYSDLHQRIWAGEFVLNDNHTKTTFGRVHWQQFLYETEQPRYKEALGIVAEHSSGNHTGVYSGEL